MRKLYLLHSGNAIDWGVKMKASQFVMAKHLKLVRVLLNEV